MPMLYCIKMVPTRIEQTEPAELIEVLGIASSLLSAAGEHWSEARRCRDILDELGRFVLKQLMSTENTSSSGDQTGRRRGRNVSRQPLAIASTPLSLPPEAGFSDTGLMYTPVVEPSAFFDEFLRRGSFGNVVVDEDPSNTDEIVRNMFQECTNPFG
ncbi:hypothetical protein QQS21_007446 [Conoideocrella luteorostrata]|uniref:Uncharacterized protein n=1 Tax=Conoideocrella luteorostrata TaxID=1105319 RepID=A0AAJ0CKN9_9HYPO|nr:hypothetical protein QQS21_007446 [Conoideocrella luteorostrata]